MTLPSPEPLPLLSREDILACAEQAGIVLPAEQETGVLAGAQRLREAAIQVRDFLAERKP